MDLKRKVLLLAVAPLLIAVIVIGALLMFETADLDSQQSRLLQESLLNSKREELRSYIGLAMSSIDFLYGAGRDDEGAKESAKTILSGMRFGNDGYFFVYDMKGNNLVHPSQPELVGKNLWDIKDNDGLFVIRELTERARLGGGFQRYNWIKPSTGRSTQKLGYAVALPRWGWVLGTGIYLDDVDAAAVRMRAALSDKVRKTLVGLASVALISVLTVFTAGMALNISEQRLADRKLEVLTHRIVTSQEDERARVSRELHDHICQLLVSVKYQFELVAYRLAHPGDTPVTAINKEIQSLSTAISEVRKISHDLRPAVLDNLGLPSALKQAATELADRSGLRVNVISRVVDTPLSDVQAVSLFRVTQEALRNVDQHARASRVDIVLRETDDQVMLQITDDGCGFDVQHMQQSGDRGIGLSNMRERVESNGGFFRLVSRPGCTTLTATFKRATRSTPVERRPVFDGV